MLILHACTRIEHTQHARFKFIIFSTPTPDRVLWISSPFRPRHECLHRGRRPAEEFKVWCWDSVSLCGPVFLCWNSAYWWPLLILWRNPRWEDLYTFPFCLSGQILPGRTFAFSLADHAASSSIEKLTHLSLLLTQSNLTWRSLCICPCWAADHRSSCEHMLSTLVSYKQSTKTPR